MSGYQPTPAGPSTASAITRRQSHHELPQVPDFAVVIGHEYLNGEWRYLAVAKWPPSTDQTVQSWPVTRIPQQYYHWLRTAPIARQDGTRSYYTSATVMPLVATDSPLLNFAQPRRDDDYNYMPVTRSPELQRPSTRIVLIVGQMWLVDGSVATLWTSTLKSWSIEEHSYDQRLFSALVPVDFLQGYNSLVSWNVENGIKDLCAWKIYYKVPFAVPLVSRTASQAIQGIQQAASSGMPKGPCFKMTGGASWRDYNDHNCYFDGCNAKNSSHDKLLVHIKRTHGSRMKKHVYGCGLCATTLGRHADLKRHREFACVESARKTGAKTSGDTRCQGCQKKLSRTDKLKLHEAICPHYQGMFQQSQS